LPFSAGARPKDGLGGCAGMAMATTSFFLLVFALFCFSGGLGGKGPPSTLERPEPRLNSEPRPETCDPRRATPEIFEPRLTPRFTAAPPGTQECGPALSGREPHRETLKPERGPSQISSHRCVPLDRPGPTPRRAGTPGKPPRETDRRKKGKGRGRKEGEGRRRGGVAPRFLPLPRGVPQDGAGAPA